MGDRVYMCRKQLHAAGEPYPCDDCVEVTDQTKVVGDGGVGMDKIYIAGPMRGYENCNFDAFDSARDAITEAGDIAISPADMDRLYEGWGKYAPEGLEFTLEDCKRFMRRDLAVIEECDAIYMLIGWEQSKGATLEKAYADYLGLKVILQKEDERC